MPDETDVASVLKAKAGWNGLHRRPLVYRSNSAMHVLYSQRCATPVPGVKETPRSTSAKPALRSV